MEVNYLKDPFEADSKEPNAFFLERIEAHMARRPPTP